MRQFIAFHVACFALGFTAGVWTREARWDEPIHAIATNLTECEWEASPKRIVLRLPPPRTGPFHDQRERGWQLFDGVHPVNTTFTLASQEPTPTPPPPVSPSEPGYDEGRDDAAPASNWRWLGLIVFFVVVAGLTGKWLKSRQPSPPPSIGQKKG